MSEITPEQRKKAFKSRRARRAGDWSDAADLPEKLDLSTQPIAEEVGSFAVGQTIREDQPSQVTDQNHSSDTTPVAVVSPSGDNSSLQAERGSLFGTPEKVTPLSPASEDIQLSEAPVSSHVAELPDESGLKKRNIRPVDESTLPTRPRLTTVQPEHPFDGYKEFLQGPAEPTSMLTLPEGVELKPIAGDGLPEPLVWDPPQSNQAPLDNNQF